MSSKDHPLLIFWSLSILLLYHNLWYSNMAVVLTRFCPFPPIFSLGNLLSLRFHSIRKLCLRCYALSILFPWFSFWFPYHYNLILMGFCTHRKHETQSILSFGNFLYTLFGNFFRLLLFSPARHPKERRRTLVEIFFDK